jgi:coatomer protein complex subunit gamma
LPTLPCTALSQLCEFIEDCEFTKLSVRILHLLGVEGPKTPQPARYIRYIYNRVVLENAIVRAAAVSSLAKFGVNVSDGGVKSSIKVLLTRCLDDVDDEVRDRAAMYLRVMQSEPLAETLVKDGAPGPTSQPVVANLRVHRLILRPARPRGQARLLHGRSERLFAAL